MTEPPLPDVPTLRCRLVYNTQSVLAASNRFFLQYAGAAPSGANCIAIADAIEAAWVTNLAPIVNENDSLGEVDVLDIATDSGFSGQWTGTESGSPVASFPRGPSAAAKSTPGASFTLTLLSAGAMSTNRLPTMSWRDPGLSCLRCSR